MKDIGNIGWIKAMLGRVKGICDHVLNHNFPLALFREKVASHPELNNKDLKLPGATRFGSHFIMIERANELKVALRELVVDPKYENCHAFDKQIQQTILSGDFWQHVTEAITVMEPVFSFIRFADGATPDVGKVYEKIRDTGKAILESGSTNATEAHRCYLVRLTGTTRRIGLHHKAHSAAMLLYPHNWNVDFAEKYPDSFAAIRNDLVDIISQVSVTPAAAARALLQYDNEYKGKTLGSFRKPIIQAIASECVYAPTWWESNACEIPELQLVAMRILSLGIANSAAERNWSVHGFLHSQRRNRLSFCKQRQLVNVHVNVSLRKKLEDLRANRYFPSDSDSDEEAEEEDEMEEEINQIVA
jgi:hypothetical protein